MQQLSLFGPRVVDSPTSGPRVIASWNVNSIRARKELALEWLAEHKPDVLCIQETRVADHQFPVDAFADKGYDVAIHGEPGHNGVAILSRHKLTDIQAGLGVTGLAEQARIISACTPDTRIINIYAPNAQSFSHPSYRYRCHWFETVFEVLRDTFDPSQNLLLCGDFNVAPSDSDVYDIHAWICEMFVEPEGRRFYNNLLSLGFVDLLARAQDGRTSFTWWDHGDGYSQNRGMRLDLVLGSPAIARKAANAWVDAATRAAPKPSDHAPVLFQWNA